MDAKQFDTLSRSLADRHSRRDTLATLLGGSPGLVGLTQADAKKKCPPCKKRKKGKCKANLPDGMTCTGGVCRGGRCCGPDSCGGSCGSCPIAGTVCTAGQCVNGSLGPGAPCNPAIPRACSSGVCGCILGTDCTCRSQTCTALSEPCTTTAECCSGSCFPVPFVGQVCAEVSSP